MKKKLFNIKKILLGFLIFAVLLSACSKTNASYNLVLSPANEGYAVVQFLDVGQADCTLITLPDGRNVLVDAGNKADGEKIVKYLQDLKVEKIHYIICSHPHEDHIGGMADVISYFDFDKIIMPYIANEDVDGSGIYEALLLTIKQIGKNVTTALPGTMVSEDGLIIECLAPRYSSYGNMNDYSAVMMISFKNTDILFAGDAEKTSEIEMVAEAYDKLDADILKVGHHGSSTATSEEFLDAITPKYAVISCGKDNQYNHPHSDVINKLNDADCKILQTDTNGSVVFYIDDDGIVNYQTTKDICLNGD